MNYLLDTHSFLWSLFAPQKLSKSATAVITSRNNTIYVSLVSFWEISLKYGLGKLEIGAIKPEQLPERARLAGLDVLGLELHDLVSYYQLPRVGHGDPFDRMLIWQAIQNRLVMISADNSFSSYTSHGLELLW